MTSAQCPLCATLADCQGRLARDEIAARLHTLFGVPVPAAAVSADYNALKCPHCTLVFFDPPEPGNAVFYEWVSGIKGYYPRNRWEWDVVIRRIAPGDGKLLLEVGCGSGSFLRRLKAEARVRGVGLDVTASAVAACQTAQLEAYCQPLEDFHVEGLADFDYVCAFHCLEHVADPKGLVLQMKQRLRPGGKLFLSTPYSPMSHEAAWYDPLNHPPHHLTRWNARAYVELARKLGMELELATPPAAPVRYRARVATALQVTRWRLATSRLAPLFALLHPRLFKAELARQRQRELLNGACAPDLVLAILTNSSGV